MQLELVGDFPETDLCYGFLAGGRCLEQSLGSSSESLNLFLNRNLSKNTLSYSGNDGDSPEALSCNARVPELAKGSVQNPLLVNMLKIMIFEGLQPDLKRISR